MNRGSTPNKHVAVASKAKIEYLSRKYSISISGFWWITLFTDVHQINPIDLSPLLKTSIFPEEYNISGFASQSAVPFECNLWFRMVKCSSEKSLMWEKLLKVRLAVVGLQNKTGWINCVQYKYKTVF